MAKIHGQWCGPNWTQGKNQSAGAPGVNFNAPCNDALDCACRAHDKDCSHADGCSSKADRKLVLAALKYAANPINQLLRPGTVLKAQAVAIGITGASTIRKR